MRRWRDEEDDCLLAGKPSFQAVGWLLLATGIGGLAAGVIGAQRLGDLVLSGLWTGILAILIGLSLALTPRAYNGQGNFVVLCISCVLLLASVVVSLFFTSGTYMLLVGHNACAEETSNYSDTCDATPYRKCYYDRNFYSEALDCVDQANYRGYDTGCSCYDFHRGCVQYSHVDNCNVVVNQAPKDFFIAMVFYFATGVVTIVLFFLLCANCCCPWCMRTRSEALELERTRLPTMVASRL